MRSSKRGPWSGSLGRLNQDALRPVWVQLAVVYPTEVATPHTGVGYNLTKEVRGELRQWIRSTAGHWLGVVDLRLASGDGDVVELRQLVIAAALRPRDDGFTLDGRLDRLRR